MTPYPNQNLVTFENLSDKRNICVVIILEMVRQGEISFTWTALPSWTLILRIAGGPFFLFLSLIFRHFFQFFSYFFFLMGMCVFFTSASVSNLISCLPPGSDGSSSQRLSVSLTTRTTLRLVASSTRCVQVTTWIFSSPSS